MQVIFQITPPTMTAVVAGDDLLLLFSNEVQIAAVAEINSTARMIDWWPVFLLKALALVSMLFFFWVSLYLPLSSTLEALSHPCSCCLCRRVPEKYNRCQYMSITIVSGSCFKIYVGRRIITGWKTDLTPSLLSTLVVNSAWALDRDAPVAR